MGEEEEEEGVWAGDERVRRFFCCLFLFSFCFSLPFFC